MIPEPKRTTKVYGVRLNGTDRTKLEDLASRMHRPVSEVMRILVRLAQPVDLAPVQFATTSEEKCDV